MSESPDVKFNDKKRVASTAVQLCLTCGRAELNRLFVSPLSTKVTSNNYQTLKKKKKKMYFNIN